MIQTPIQVSPTLVTLNEHELKFATYIGKKRYQSSRTAGLKFGHGLTDDYKAQAGDILGACGEMAVAKCLNLYWTAGINTFHDADISDNIQVRTTVYKSGGLIIRKTDNPEHYFYLVVADSPRFSIIGWIQGRSAMIEKNIHAPDKSRPTCWFVKQHELNPTERKTPCHTK